MKSLFCRLTGRDAPGEPVTRLMSRLEKLVCREASAAAAAAQSKLSRQVSDPATEEAPLPLYDVSAYVSRPAASGE